MRERTLAVFGSHFVTRLTSQYRAIADEFAWRRAATLVGRTAHVSGSSERCS